jgi:hypothetical protein
VSPKSRTACWRATQKFIPANVQLSDRGYFPATISSRLFTVHCKTACYNTELRAIVDCYLCSKKFQMVDGQLLSTLNFICRKRFHRIHCVPYPLYSREGPPFKHEETCIFLPCIGDTTRYYTHWLQYRSIIHLIILGILFLITSTYLQRKSV